MKKLNLKKIITMGLITTSILAVVPVGANAEWREDSTGIYFKADNDINRSTSCWIMNGVNDGIREWYRVDSNGYIIKSCWYQEGSNWYYLMSDGIMATGNNVNTEGYLSNFNNSGAWLGYVYTNGNKTIATVANTAPEMTIEPLHKKAVDAAIKDTVNALFTYPEARNLFYLKYPPFANYTESSRCDSFVPDYVQGLSLQDAKGKYQLFPTTKDGKYVGIVKMYQDGSWKEFEPGEYDGTSAQAEENKYIHGVA